MKYFIQSNKEFYYEDLESEEFLLFSAPDDFKFTNELIEKFYDFIHVEHRIATALDCVQVKYNQWYDKSATRILSVDNEERKNFILWLEQFNVKLLNHEIIE